MSKPRSYPDSPEPDSVAKGVRAAFGGKQWWVTRTARNALMRPRRTDRAAPPGGAPAFRVYGVPAGEAGYQAGTLAQP